MPAATSAASASCSLLAPASRAALVCSAMQYGHCVVSATATAISCFCWTERTLGEHGLVEGPEALHRFGRVLVELLEAGQVFHIEHGNLR